MLKTTSLTCWSTISQSLIDATNDNEFGESGGNETNLSNPSVSKKSTKASYLNSKSARICGNNLKKGCSNNKKGVKAAIGYNYLIPNAKKVFNYLWHMFTQVPILQHFVPKRHIWIETNASGYAIGGVLNQLTWDNLVQWHPVAYCLRKIIPAKTRYKIHNSEHLAIIKAFKITQHYLEDCKHKVLLLTNYNNLCCFFDTKSLSFCQIRLA